jgi:hypothetical protein
MVAGWIASALSLLTQIWTEATIFLVVIIAILRHRGSNSANPNLRQLTAAGLTK